MKEADRIKNLGRLVASQQGEVPTISEKEIDYHLRGNTLLAYWYLLTVSSSTTIRQLQRALNLSSPSVSSHHLNRLVELELCEKQHNGTYCLTKMVHVGVLKHFVRIRGRLLPRYFFVALFFSITLFFFSLMSLFAEAGPFDRLVTFGSLLVGAIIGWIETYRLYKLRVL